MQEDAAGRPWRRAASAGVIGLVQALQQLLQVSQLGVLHTNRLNTISVSSKNEGSEKLLSDGEQAVD